MEKLIENIKNSPLASGTHEIYYPGELEARSERRHLEQGITIPEDTLVELDAAAKDIGVVPLSAFTLGSEGS
jgi:LDH2 family malate/lactate/ureidoglycolate dehydrogenase